MIIASGLNAEDNLGQVVLNSGGLATLQQFAKTVYIVFKDQFFKHRFARGRTHEGMMSVLGHIDAHHQVLIGSVDFALNLTKLLTSGNFLLAHITSF
jgi:hypothetical protein